MNTNRRRPAALALIAVVALVSACGSSAPAGTHHDTSASATSAGAARGTGRGAGRTAGSGGGKHTTRTGGPHISKREKAVKFAECMRSNGVSDFPDPTASGDFMYGVSVTPAVFDSAVNACKALQPPGSLSGQRSSKQQSLALKFAACVRKNGVPDFPDPVNGQPLIDTYKIPSSNAPGGMTILNAATHKCSGLLQLAARGGGGGTGG